MQTSARESSCSWASFWASFRFWSILVAFGRRMGRRFGRRFVFGRFWSLLGVVWGFVLFWSVLVAFERRMGRRFVLVVFGHF